MKINDIEKLGLGLILKYPNSSENIPQKMVSELQPSRFQSNINKLIYMAVKNLVIKNEVPNILNVSLELGEELRTIGGIEYLESLLTYPDTIGLNGIDSLGQWVRSIDNAGRLRHLGNVIDTYSKYYEDFERLFSQVSDVDEFMSNFMEEVNKDARSLRTGYKPIKDAVEEEKRFAQQEGDGKITDIIYCGMPKLAKYMIPRPCSLGTIMGLSSLGKTSLAFQILLGTAINIYNSGSEGVVAINSLETSSRKIARLLACIWSSTDSMKLAHGELSKPQFNKYMEALEFISQLPIRYNDNPDITTDELSWNAIAQDYQEKRILGISDYAELFKDEHKSEELRVSNIVRNHRRIAWRIDSCEILLSQVTTNSTTKWALLSDARYTRSFEQALDWGLVIYNPPQMTRRGITFVIKPGKKEEFAYWSLQKNKGYDVGEECLSWEAEYSRFKDMALPMGQLYDFGDNHSTEDEW